MGLACYLNAALTALVQLEVDSECTDENRMISLDASGTEELLAERGGSPESVVPPNGEAFEVAQSKWCGLHAMARFADKWRHCKAHVGVGLGQL